MTVNLPPPTQVQAAIRKKVEKQKKRTNEQGVGAGDVQMATPQPHPPQKAGQSPQVMSTDPEDRQILEETLEEMMQGPQRRDREEEEAEPVDLLPIVDSVFGQVGAICCTCN